MGVGLGMWSPLIEDGFGLMKSLSDSITRAFLSDPDLLPDLRDAGAVLATSDYSGQHKASRFEAYAFLIVTPRGWGAWERRRLELRRSFRAGGRRISYKGLGDALKRRMLPGFLNAANRLPGLCVCVLVEKAVGSLFRPEGALDPSEPGLEAVAGHGPATAEKLLRVVHLASFFLAGLTRAGQDMFWFTDQDDIAPNDAAVARVTGLWANVLSHYLRHTVGHLRFGTTKCDNGTLQLEDLAAIPDLVAGAGAEVANGYAAAGALPAGKVVIPVPQRVPQKAREIIYWLSEEPWPLRRLVYCFEKDPASSAVSIKRLRFHAIRPGT